MERLKLKSLLLLLFIPFLYYFYFFKEDFIKRLVALIILLMFSLIFENLSLFLKKLKVVLNIMIKNKTFYFSLLFILNFFLIWNFTKNFKYLGGDEPHYLVITQSIVEDGDIDLSNNYRKMSYKVFHPIKLIPHSHFTKRKKGWYPFHSPALSIILIPPYLLIKFLNIKDYFLSTFIFRFYISWFGLLFVFIFYSFLKEKDNENTLFLISIFFFTPPLYFFSIHLYPEIFALLLGFASFTFIIKEKPLWAGLILSFLVFFHTKLLIIEVGFLLFYFFYKGKRGLFKLSVFPALLFFLHLLYLKLIYGSFSPTFVYEGMGSGKWLKIVFSIPLKMRVESFLNYFLDQRDGLFLYAPYFILILFSFLIIKRSKKILFSFIFIFLPYTFYYAFLTIRGAYSPPARPLVAVLWVLFLILYYFVEENREYKRLFFVLLFPTYYFFLTLINNPLFLYQSTTSGIRERASAILVFMSNLYVYLPKYFPSFIKSSVNNFSYLPNILWIIFYCIIGFLFYRLKDKKYLTNFFFFAVTSFFLISRVFFPYPQATSPLTLKGVKGITFYNLSRDLRILHNEKGFFIVHNRGESFQILFSSEKPLKKLKIKIGSKGNLFDIELSLGDYKIKKENISEENINLSKIPYYKKKNSYFYILKLKFKEKRDLRKFPFIVIFSEI